MSSGKLSRRLEVSLARQLSASASITRGACVARSAEHTPTVAALTRMPGPTTTAPARSASFAATPAASSEKVPSAASQGSGTTGISIMWACTTGATQAGTARVT